MTEIPRDILDSLIDDLNLALFITDGDGIVHQLNERASSIIRLPKITAVGRQLKRLLPPEVAAILDSERREALATGQTRHIPGKSLILPGWGIRYFDIRVIPYRRPGSGPWAAHILLDITNRERREIASEKARENAEAEARARRAFLARMSHEIRTPMNGIMGMTDLALQSGPPTEIAEYLDVIRNASDSLLGILNDVLDFAKVESGRMELEQLPLKLSAILDETITLLKPGAEDKEIRISGEVDEELPEILIGDPTRIRQILTNLIGNAVKFTESGSVRIRLEPGPLPPDAEESDIFITGSVSDTGIGIKPEKMESLFDAFTQSDLSISREYGGTGLGLAICRTLARLMDGDVEAESIPGEGSIFRFRIRLKRFSPESSGRKRSISDEQNFPEEKKALKRQPRWEGITVLLAEDNRVNRLVAENLLKRAGLEVISCPDGMKAVSAWRESAPDIILMDLQMPGMDGIEAARIIRESENAREKKYGETEKSAKEELDITAEGAGGSGAAGEYRPGVQSHRIPIIALTAHIMEEERKAAEEAGMDGWVGKPVKPADLYAELERFLPPVLSDEVQE